MKEYIEDTAKIFLVVTVLLIILFSVVGCGIVDFRSKTIATETKVIGLDATIPSLTTGDSLAAIRLGYISTKYVSVPDGGSAGIEDEYKDCSLLSISGNATSIVSATNNDSPRGK